jgi:hypothetical protein
VPSVTARRTDAADTLDIGGAAMTSRIAFLLSFALAVLLGPVRSLAFGDGTPDGSPPAEETVCEDAGLMGAAFGLCVAFCEANDCDTTPDAQACTVLRSNYAKITGDFAFPCETGGEEGPS